MKIEIQISHKEKIWKGETADVEMNLENLEELLQSLKCAAKERLSIKRKKYEEEKLFGAN